MNTFIQNTGIPSNSPATLVIGNARLTRDELTALLIQAGHPDPHVATVWLMNGTTRQTLIMRTAQDLMNEMEVGELRGHRGVLLNALRNRLSPRTLEVLDAVVEKRSTSAREVAERFGLSEQNAGNTLALLHRLGIVERKSVATVPRSSYVYSPHPSVLP